MNNNFLFIYFCIFASSGPRLIADGRDILGNIVRLTFRCLRTDTSHCMRLSNQSKRIIKREFAKINLRRRFKIARLYLSLELFLGFSRFYLVNFTFLMIFFTFFKSSYFDFFFTVKSSQARNNSRRILRRSRRKKLVKVLLLTFSLSLL